MMIHPPADFRIGEILRRIGAHRCIDFPKEEIQGGISCYPLLDFRPTTSHGLLVGQAYLPRSSRVPSPLSAQRLRVCLVPSPDHGSGQRVAGGQRRIAIPARVI